MPTRPPAAVAPRGPLPPGVYWRRRLFISCLVVSLVFVVVRWAASGDSSPEEPAAAQQAAAPVVPSETVTVGAEDSDGTDGTDGTGGAGGSATATSTPTLAEPDGPCRAEDIVATPTVADDQAAGEDVAIDLLLQTVRAEACTWDVTGTRLVVRISQGGKQLWTTQECRRAVPERSVVVRRGVATVLPLTWNARESDQGCTGRTNWVLPGEFTVAAAALGGEPAQAEFTLVSPSAKPVEMRWEPAPGLG